MYEMFMDTSHKMLTITIFKDNELVSSMECEADQKQADLAVSILSEALGKAKLKLSQISEITCVNGPGSFTGIRVGMTIVKVIWTLCPTLKVRTIDSLTLQAADKDCISILTAYNNKFYLAAFENNQTILPIQLVSDEAVEGITKKLSQLKIFKDFKEIDVLKNFQLCKSLGKLIEINNIKDFEPHYLTDGAQSLKKNNLV